MDVQEQHLIAVQEHVFNVWVVVTAMMEYLAQQTAAFQEAAIILLIMDYAMIIISAMELRHAMHYLDASQELH